MCLCLFWRQLAVYDEVQAQLKKKQEQEQRLKFCSVNVAGVKYAFRAFDA